MGYGKSSLFIKWSFYRLRLGSKGKKTIESNEETYIFFPLKNSQTGSKSYDTYWMEWSLRSMVPETLYVPYKTTRIEIACFLAPGQLGYNLYLNDLAF